MGEYERPARGGRGRRTRSRRRRARDRRAEGAQRVLRRERRRAPVPDEKRAGRRDGRGRSSWLRGEGVDVLGATSLRRVAEDHPIRRPLHRSAIVRPRRCRRGTTGAASSASSSRSGARSARAMLEPAAALAAPSAASRGRGRTCCSAAPATAEPGAARPRASRRRRPTRRSSPGTAATLSATTPPGASRERTRLEELPRGEVERHVRLPVGVDHDQVVVRLGRRRNGRASASCVTSRGLSPSPSHFRPTRVTAGSISTPSIRAPG